jgi:hypothetical protein
MKFLAAGQVGSHKPPLKIEIDVPLDPCLIEHGAIDIPYSRQNTCTECHGYIASAVSQAPRALGFILIIPQQNCGKTSPTKSDVVRLQSEAT